MDEVAVDSWGDAFARFHARFAPFFFRQEVRERSARSLRGLLGPIERKNGWQLAEAAGERDPQGMQRLLFAARWDAEAVRDELQRFVLERFGDPQAIVVFDETGFVKKGRKSAGVKRQYSGTAGKVENCQVGVFLAYVSRHGHALLDRRLYLPREWAEDPERRREAAVPESVPFETKPELAWEMLEQAREQGLRARWVVGDTVYGQDPGLRAKLETLAPACHYVLAVPSGTPVWTPPAGEAVPPDPPPAGLAHTWRGHAAAALVGGLGAEHWQPLTVGAGAKGPRTYAWAAVRVAAGAQGWPGPERWLLARRSPGEPTALAYYLSNAPADTPRATLARVAGARWPIEQCFEEAKGEAGLDHYEVRRWDSWQRHVTLVMLAHTFLADLRREAGGKYGPGERAGGAERAGSAAAAGSGAALARARSRSPAGLVALAPPPSSAGTPRPLPTPSDVRPRPLRHPPTYLRL